MNGNSHHAMNGNSHHAMNGREHPCNEWEGASMIQSNMHRWSLRGWTGPRQSSIHVMHTQSIVSQEQDGDRTYPQCGSGAVNDHLPPVCQQRIVAVVGVVECLSGPGSRSSQH